MKTDNSIGYHKVPVFSPQIKYNMVKIKCLIILLSLLEEFKFSMKVLEMFKLERFYGLTQKLEYAETGQ
jgi:hypothetical protein